MSDVGLFGPESVSWRVHVEPILWLAGFRALLMQMLLPRALGGVLQNSSFRADPWGRLLRTAQFYGTVVYGETERAEAAGARVRRIHAHLSAVDPGTGDRYRVDEPDLLRWIHVTATESFLDTAQRAGLGLTPDEADRYLDEQRVVARLVGLDPETVPATTAEVDEYYAAMRPQLAADADARATARYLALPTFPWRLGWTPVRPLWIGVAAYGFSFLPAWARRLYGSPGLAITDATTTLSARALRSALRAVPSSALEGPIYRAALERAGVRPTSATRNTGESAKSAQTRIAGTAKAQRKVVTSAMTPIKAAPTTKPA
jgi:uncharacterized protein (DUF2236 family)